MESLLSPWIVISITCIKLLVIEFILFALKMTIRKAVVGISSYALSWIHVHIQFVWVLLWRLINTDILKVVFLLIILCTTRPKMVAGFFSFLMICSIYGFFHSHIFRFYLSVNVGCGHLLVIADSIHIVDFIINLRFVDELSLVVLFGLLSLLDVGEESLLILTLSWLYILCRNCALCLQLHGKLFIFFMLCGLLCSVWFWAVALSIGIGVDWMAWKVLLMIILTHSFLLLWLHLWHLYNFPKNNLILIIYPHWWNLITFDIVSIASLGFLGLLFIIILNLRCVDVHGWLLLWIRLLPYLTHLLQLLLHQVQTRFALMLTLFVLLEIFLFDLRMTVILF